MPVVIQLIGGAHAAQLVAGTRVTATVAADVGPAAAVATRRHPRWWTARRIAIASVALAGLIALSIANPVVVVAALGTGFLNITSGGGAVVAFLAMTMALGIPALTAHATSQCTTPAPFLAVLGNVRAHWPGRWPLIVGCSGTVVGVAILTSTSPGTFELVAPFMLIVAGALVLCQGPLQRRAQRLGWALGPKTTYLLLFLCGIYAGIIGVGTGTVTLVALSVATRYVQTDLHSLILLRNVLLLGMAAVVSVAFAITGLVNWALAALLVLPSMVGGWAGVAVLHRMPVPLLRGLIAITAVGGAAWMWVR